MTYNELLHQTYVMIKEYDSRSTEDINHELSDIIRTYSYGYRDLLAEKTGLPKYLLYMITRKNSKRVSFDSYVRIVEAGVNKFDTDKENRKHKYGNRNNKECCDHLGHSYESRQDMAREYGISPSLLCHRLKRGWSLEKTLTTPIKR